VVDPPPSHKWIVLSNTTLGVLMATIDSSITLIALPDIFRGIELDPLLPANSFYLFWMILSFLVVSSVLVASLGRLGDLYGRVRMYNLGFALYTLASLLLTITWMTGREAALYLVIMRVFQGVGAAFLVGTSPAILTDAFPAHQRGLALGLNSVAGISGSFVGLVLGGVLAPINWRLIFLISVPIGLFGTVWAYLKLEDRRPPGRARIDWAGNVTFAAGLVALMIGVTYGIQPYGDDTMGWTSPAVLGELSAGVALLIAFLFIEARAEEPMFPLPLLRIRAFSAGVLATFLAAVGRGGLMFILIIWLQGIWLPLHGYSFARTPLWAGIYMLHRDLLHADDRRAGLGAALQPRPRPRRPGGEPGRGPPGGRAAAHLDALRRLPRLQPDGAPARSPHPGRAAGGSRRGGDRPRVLPEPDLRPVRDRPARGLRVRHRRLARGRGRLAAARRGAPAPARGPRHRADPRDGGGHGLR
jgi:MFS family permease